MLTESQIAAECGKGSVYHLAPELAALGLAKARRKPGKPKDERI